MRRTQFTEVLESRLLRAGVTIIQTPDLFHPIVTLPANIEITHRGTLVVHGTGAADDIKTDKFLDQVTVSFQTTHQTFQIPAAKVKRILIEGGGGDDSLKDATDLHATLMGESGNDVLIGGRGDVLVGGAGNDKLFAGIFGTGINVPDLQAQNGLNTGTQSELHGGSGRDRLYGFGGDIMDGAGGNDQALLYQIFVAADSPAIPTDPAAFAQDQFDSRANSIESFGLERALLKTTPNDDGSFTSISLG